MRPGPGQRHKQTRQAAGSAGAHQRSAPPARNAHSRIPTAAMLAVAIGAILVHAQTVTFDFTNWDDDINVTQNPYVTPPSWAGTIHHWTHAYRSLYVPLVYTTFALDGLVGGGRPWAFHLTNVLLHAAASIAVLLIVRMLLAERASAEAMTPQRWGWVSAGMAALVFAWHPVQVEAVSWITGRKDVLSGCLALWAVWFYLRSPLFAGAGTLSRHLRAGPGQYAIATGLFLLSLAAKPSAVALPIGLLAVEWSVRRTSLLEAARRLAPWFGLAAVWAVITALSQPAHPLLAAASPFWKRPLIAADAVWFYVRSLVWPLGLAPVYGRTPDLVAANMGTILGLVGILVFAVAALLVRGVWSACAMFALALLMPVLGLTPFLFQYFSTVADRYLYVPMLGFSLATGAVLQAAWQWSRRWRFIAFTVVAVVLLFWALLSILQARVWRDSFTLWEHNIRLYPRAASAYHNLANAHVLAGRDEPAYPLFEQALRLDPDFGESHNNLGLIEGRRGRHEQAVERYRAALAAYERLNLRDTRVFEARVNMSASLLALGRLDEAHDQLKTALEMHPDSWQALTNMGLVLAAKGETTKAREYLRKALEYSPGNPKVLSELERLAAPPPRR